MSNGPKCKLKKNSLPSPSQIHRYSSPLSISFQFLNFLSLSTCIGAHPVRRPPTIATPTTTDHHVANPEPLIGRSGSLRPVIEGPDPDGGEIGDSKRGLGLGQSMKGQLSRTPSVASNAYKQSDLRLLLGVLGAPLSPVQVSANDPLPHLCIKDTPILAISMATKATSLARELKSIKSDFCFMQERCALFEEENRRLHDGFAKGIRPEEDDLVLILQDSVEEKDDKITRSKQELQQRRHSGRGED
ncbi:hypothetical protein LOK49_LG03G00771 [Camellia lanceoleosa]|uniref:Uncharacterized protein n=1 Tax=Camellia lanceoleosa TaxID=1840588 RepID=A0ACC0I7G6_9ERIC|nr:hypothetical protein LOK49_LG03G00771 [Camellia lanceoleosa]